MNPVLAGVLAVSLLAATPPSAALVAGTVRDEQGAPVGDASVTFYDGTQEVGTARTASDGTFVFDGSATKVRIRCAYCRTTEENVGRDGIATAVVQRYDAARSDGPTPADIASLPAATIPSLLERVPFVVVNETSRALPGASATDRNATIYGGLFLLDYAPDYDITARVSPFGSVPQGGAASLSVLRVDQAYQYGDVAQGGTFVVQTPGGAARAGSGSDTLLRGAANEGSFWATAAYSNTNGGDRAERGSVTDTFTTPGTSSALTVSSGSGYELPQGHSALFSSFSSATAQVHARGAIDAFALATVDHGSYAYSSAQYPVSSAWSDVHVQAGVDSHAVVAPFVHFDVRQSSGSYLSNSTGSIAGWLSQARTTSGVSFHSSQLDALVAGGIDAIGYTDVIGPGMRYAQNAHDGVFSFTYRPLPEWSLHASTSSGYSLQTYLNIYLPFDGTRFGTPVVAGHTNEATLEFGDQSRVRADVTALQWSAANGEAASSAGASVAWQITPKLSLRTWLLRAQSNAFSPSTVGSAWLTYANRDDFRVDLTLARSLLDQSPYEHLDASVAGRITDHLDWFASSAHVSGSQQTSVGVRIR